MKQRATRRNSLLGRLFGSKTTYRRTRTAGPSRRAVSEKAAARQAKELEAERLHKKFTDAQLDRKLKAHYAKGGNLKEFMAMNPGIPGSAFKRCVARVAEKGGAYDPRAVCASAGRKKYGAKKFQAMAKAGRKRAARGGKRNAAALAVHGRGWIQETYETGDPDLKRRARELRAKGYRVVSSSMGNQVTQWGVLKMTLLDIRPGSSGDADLERIANPARAAKAGRERAARRNAGVVKRTMTARQMAETPHTLKRDGRAELPDGSVWLWDKRFEHWAMWQAPKRNPAAAAAEVYEEFHGTPSTSVVELTERLHFHEHLAELGRLELLVVNGIDGYEHRISGFKGAKLCSNETKDQLFIRGGDQAVDLSDYGIKPPHEVETLGQVTEIQYFTTKKHLGSEGGTAIYFHKAGTTSLNGRHKKVGYGPDLIYRVRDKALEFSGGTYEIRAEGIDK